MKCPKCGTEVRDVARFCTRCHATLRFECPACHHEQRQGGSCEKCGVDFMKYLSSMITVKKVEAEHEHVRNQRRSWFMKQILYFPITGGLHLLKDLFHRKES
jgi:methionyl-tRNA synthetase